MIEMLFEAPYCLRRHREGLFGPHVDAFAAWLAARGYTADTIRALVCGARTFSEWLDGRSHELEDVDDRLAAHFVKKSKCAESHRKTLRQSVQHVLTFLRAEGLIAPAPEVPAPDPEVVVQFEKWMREHRGVQRSTVDLYLPIVRELVSYRLAFGIQDPAASVAVCLHRVVTESAQAKRHRLLADFELLRELLHDVLDVPRLQRPKMTMNHVLRH